jgi:hypothetical protein
MSGIARSLLSYSAGSAVGTSLTRCDVRTQVRTTRQSGHQPTITQIMVYGRGTALRRSPRRPTAAPPVLSIGLMSPFCISRKGRTSHLTAAYGSIVDSDKPRMTYFVSDASVIQQPAHLILSVAALRALQPCRILFLRDPLSLFGLFVRCIWRRRMPVPTIAYF